MHSGYASLWVVGAIINNMVIVALLSNPFLGVSMEHTEYVMVKEHAYNHRSIREDTITKQGCGLCGMEKQAPQPCYHDHHGSYDQTDLYRHVEGYYTCDFQRV